MNQKGEILTPKSMNELGKKLKFETLILAKE
jgi:hypothetical protein